MKNFVFSIIFVLCMGFSAFSQNFEDGFNPAYANKRGVYLLPQAGDFAIGVDATPFLSFVGNIFTSGANTPPLFDGVNQTIYGKYFVQDFRAVRVRLTLNMSNNTIKGEVADDVKQSATPQDPDAILFDAQKLSYSYVEIGAGYEVRRGNGRVQGFWGGEVFFGVSNEKEKYEYANNMTTNNQTPSTYSFPGYNNRLSTSERVTERKPDSNIFAGLGTFVGIEYFVAPQISIGGEFGLGFMFRSSAQSESTSERWNSTDNKKEINTETNPYWDSNQFEFFSRTSGHIFMMFHF